jgi:hypothetical protein
MEIWRNLQLFVSSACQATVNVASRIAKKNSNIWKLSGHIDINTHPSVKRTMICDPQEESQEGRGERDDESAELLRRIDRALKTLTIDELRLLVVEIESRMVKPN